MVKVVKVANGKYIDYGDNTPRQYFLTGAVTANSTVVTGARVGDTIRTTNATGRSSVFVSDGSSKAQFLTNA